MEEFLDATVKNIELGRHRRARIWLGSLPDAAYRSPGKLARSWVASLAPPVANRSAAVELLVPKGGRFTYGLLGGRIRGSCPAAVRKGRRTTTRIPAALPNRSI